MSSSRTAAERREPGTAGVLRRFTGWWMDALFGASGRGGLRKPLTRCVILLVDGRTMRAFIIDRGDVRELGRVPIRPRSAEAGPVDLDPPTREFVDAVNAARLPVTLRFARRHGLLCHDRLPAAALDELDAIIANRLDVLTPMTPDQAAFAALPGQPDADGEVEIEVAAIERDLMEERRREIEAMGIEIDTVDLVLADSLAPPTFDLAGGEWPVALRRRFSLLLIPVLAIGFAVALARGWSEVDAQGRLLAEQQELLGALQARLADIPEIRARIEAIRGEADAIADRLASHPSSIVTIDRLSAVLPDTVWLDALTIEGAVLRIEGYAPDVTGLVPILEADAMFKEVAFAAASTVETLVDPAENEVTLERFSIEARLDKPGDHQPGDAQPENLLPASGAPLAPALGDGAAGSPEAAQ